YLVGRGCRGMGGCNHGGLRTQMAVAYPGGNCGWGGRVCSGWVAWFLHHLSTGCGADCIFLNPCLHTVNRVSTMPVRLQILACFWFLLDEQGRFACLTVSICSLRCTMI